MSSCLPYGLLQWLSGKESTCNAGGLWETIHLQCRRQVDPWVGKIPWKRARQPTPVFLPGRIPWTGEPGGQQSIGSHRAGVDWSDLVHTYQPYSLIQPRSAYMRPMVINLSHLHMIYGEGNGNPLQYSCLENPRTEEPGGLQSMGSLGVGHDWATSLSLFTFMHWRRKWQPTPVFLPGECQGWGSLVGCRLWGRTESAMTEAT